MHRRLIGAVVLGLMLLLVMVLPALARARTHPYNVGCQYLRQGEPGQAAAYFLKALKLSPEDTNARNNLAVCYIEQQRWGAAIDQLKKVLAVNRRYSGASLNIGADYIFQQKLGEAKEPTATATKAGGSKFAREVKASAYFNLGLVAAYDGRNDDARAAFERSLKVKPTTQAEIDLAAVMCRLGDVEAGLAALEKAGQGANGDTATLVNDNLAVAHYQRGMEQLGAKQYDAARAEFEASQKAVDNDYARLGLALVDAETGDLSEARRSLQDLEDKKGSSAEIRAAAAKDHDKLLRLADDDSALLKWMALVVGIPLVVAYLWLIVRAFRAWKYVGKWGKFKPFLGLLLLSTICTGLSELFTDPLRTWTQLIAVLVIAAVMMLVLWARSKRPKYC